MDSWSLRQAALSDYPALARFLQVQAYVHRHLDWRPTLDWLGFQPFFLLEDSTGIQAVLGCPQDPPGVAWVRVFACTDEDHLRPAWEQLFTAARQALPEPRPTLALLALYEWVADLAPWVGLHKTQDIVVLEWNQRVPPIAALQSEVHVELIRLTDLPAVLELDQQAFGSLWQLSADSLERCFRQAGYATLAWLDGQPVGYQISTHTSYAAHLARLAVRPDLQRRGIGATLLGELQTHYQNRGVWRLTVNTQSDNHASLSLYHRAGFRETGDRFPVFVYAEPQSEG